MSLARIAAAGRGVRGEVHIHNDCLDTGSACGIAGDAIDAGTDDTGAITGCSRADSDRRSANASRIGSAASDAIADDECRRCAASRRRGCRTRPWHTAAAAAPAAGGDAGAGHANRV